MVNPFLKCDPISRYRLFGEIIKNKDKHYLMIINQLLAKRLKELDK